MATKKEVQGFIRQCIDKNLPVERMKEEFTAQGVRISEKRLLKELRNVLTQLQANIGESREELTKALRQIDDLYELNLQLGQTTENRLLIKEKMAILDKIRMIDIQ